MSNSSRNTTSPGPASSDASDLPPLLLPICTTIPRISSPSKSASSISSDVTATGATELVPLCFLSPSTDDPPSDPARHFSSRAAAVPSEPEPEPWRFRLPGHVRLPVVVRPPCELCCCDEEREVDFPVTVDRKDTERCQKVVAVRARKTAGKSGMQAFTMPREGSTEVRKASSKMEVVQCFFAEGLAKARREKMRRTVMEQILGGEG